MAEVVKRIWRSGPRKVKRVAWGFTLQVDGKQVRKFNSAWSEEDAQRALAEALLGRETPAPKPPTPAGMTFREAIDRFVKTKARTRTVARERQRLTILARDFGADTLLSEITASRINAWKADRLAATCPRTGEPYSIASVNRPLQALSVVLHLATEEWETLPAVPKIKLEPAPEGHNRWLEPDEEARLLAACRAMRTSPELADIVTIALETGMRKGEILGLTWERIDLSRGVIRLQGRPRRNGDEGRTKTQRSREIPMRQAVYTLLASRPGPREGRVWPPAYITHAWERAVKAARLAAPFRFHDCRHHFASWFMMRGGDLYALSKILGHAKVGMTERYAHLAPDHLRGEMAKTERPVSAHGQHIAPERELVAP